MLRPNCPIVTDLSLAGCVCMWLLACLCVGVCIYHHGGITLMRDYLRLANCISLLQN